MVISEELINKVKSTFGLNTYEAKIWIALLAKGTATASELADLADVPRSRTYDILESLEKKGFVIMKLGKPIKYIAISPKEVLDRVKRRYEEHIQIKMKALEELKNSELISELDTLYRTGISTLDISEKSGTLRGYQNIISHMETMLKEAEKSVNIVTTELSFIRHVATLKPVLYELKERGVNINIITPIKEENAKYVKELLDFNIYDSGNLRGRVVTIDSEEILMMLFDDRNVHSSLDLAVWLYAPLVASFIDSTIEKILPTLKPANEVLAQLKF